MPISPTSSRKLNTVWRLTEFVRQFTVFTLFAWHSEECHAGSIICWGFTPKPHWGFHPQSPERGRPRRRFEHGITFYLNLYVNLPCPREKLTPIPFSLKVFGGAGTFFQKGPASFPASMGSRGSPFVKRGSPGIIFFRHPRSPVSPHRSLRADRSRRIFPPCFCRFRTVRDV